MTAFTVTFDRIGRHRNVPPLRVAGAFDDIADQIIAYADRLIFSRDVGVAIHDDWTHGFVVVGGVRNAGNFTMTEVAA